MFEVPGAFLWRWPSYATVILVSCSTVLQAFTVCQSMLRLWKQFCKRAQEGRNTEWRIYIQRMNGPNIGSTRAPTSASQNVTHKPNVNASYCLLSHCCHQVVLDFHFSMYTQPRKSWLWRHERRRVVTVESSVTYSPPKPGCDVTHKPIYVNHGQLPVTHSSTPRVCISASFFSGIRYWAVERNRSPLV